jgi:hypothetical protein
MLRLRLFEDPKRLIALKLPFTFSSMLASIEYGDWDMLNIVYHCSERGAKAKGRLSVNWKEQQPTLMNLTSFPHAV